MRFLKFAGVYIGVVLFIFILVVGFNWKEFTTVFDNSAALTEGQELVEKTFSLGGLAELIAEKPDYFSAYSTYLSSGKENLAIQADTPRPLVGLSSLILMVHILDQSIIHPEFLNQSVSLDSIERYYIPNVNRSVQEKSMELLSSKIQLNAHLTHADLLPVLTEYNTQSIFDYLLLQQDRVELTKTITRFGLPESFELIPFSGAAIQLQPQLQNKSFDDLFTSYTKNDSIWRKSVWESTKSYVQNTSFRDRVISTFSEKESGLNFLQEKQSFGLYPQTTPKNIISFFRNVLTSSDWNAETKQKLYNYLTWPMTDRSINYWFSFYGGIFESKMGLLNGIDIGSPKERNDTLIQAVFFDRIPIALWFHMSSKFINLDYQRRISWDAELRERSLHLKKQNN